MFIDIGHSYLMFCESSYGTRTIPEFESHSFGGQKSMQTFFVKVFRQPFGSWTSAPQEIVDVPHQKVRFPAAPVVGRNFLTPGHPRVRNVLGKSGPKSLCLCCFFFPRSFCTMRNVRQSCFQDGPGVEPEPESLTVRATCWELTAEPQLLEPCLFTNGTVSH